MSLFSPEWVDPFIASAISTMNTQTFTITVSASRDTVFNFLADIENLPKWAGGYCERLTLQRGRWWALTVEGEQVVDMETSAGTGVLDLRAGPLPEHMTLTPLRVIALSARRTLVSILLIESPDQGAEVFARRCRIFREAMQGMLGRFGGGEMHSPDNTPELLELGLN
jgi:hypothetical protein